MKKFVNKILIGDWVEQTHQMPDDTFHCIVTSPPYWGQRDYGIKGQLGLEKTPEIHIRKLVRGFREIRRVLRPDGVLWLNYGDKYSDGLRITNSLKQGGFETDAHVPQDRAGENCGSDQGNLLMLPARVALALQQDGWILRDDVIWAKAISFNDKYSGSTMPESVNGTRWERHRMKVGSIKDGGMQLGNTGSLTAQNGGIDKAIWQDCPGCPKCDGNGGLVLRRGSWRCTKAHEHLFQLVKSNDYFCDMDAVKEEYLYDGREDTMLKPTKKYANRNYGQSPNSCHTKGQERWPGSGRNLRNVWTINPRGYKEAHYATFPEALVEPCIKVSTSQKGVCPKCGCQWARIVKKKPSTMNIRVRDVSKGRIKHTDRTASKHEVDKYGKEYEGTTVTLGWKATCDCGIEETKPALVFDPFMGSGTTAIVATKLRRIYTGVELKPEYVKEHARRRLKERKTGISVTLQKQGYKGLLG